MRILSFIYAVVILLASTGFISRQSFCTENESYCIEIPHHTNKHGHNHEMANNGHSCCDKKEERTSCSTVSKNCCVELTSYVNLDIEHDLVFNKISLDSKVVKIDNIGFNNVFNFNSVLKKHFDVYRPPPNINSVPIYKRNMVFII